MYSSKQVSLSIVNFYTCKDELFSIKCSDPLFMNVVLM